MLNALKLNKCKCVHVDDHRGLLCFVSACEKSRLYPEGMTARVEEKKQRGGDESEARQLKRSIVSFSQCHM